MTPEQYTLKARETESPITPEVFKRAADRSSALYEFLLDFDHLLRKHRVDQLKKEIFYGKLYPEPITTNPEGFTDDQLSHEDLRFMHGFLGILTELPELYELVLLHKHENVPVDLATRTLHILEECGDLEWYLDLLENTFFIQKTSIWEANIRKLAKRKERDATLIERDLSAEAAALIAEHGTEDDDNDETHAEYVRRTGTVVPVHTQNAPLPPTPPDQEG